MAQRADSHEVPQPHRIDYDDDSDNDKDNDRDPGSAFDDSNNESSV